MIGIFHTHTLTQIGKDNLRFRSTADAQIAIDQLSKLFSKETLEAAEIGEIEYRKTQERMNMIVPRRGRKKVVKRV